MRRYGISFWKTVPFIRLLLALVAGILLERYSAISLRLLLWGIAMLAIIFLLTRSFSLRRKYASRWLGGVLLSLLLMGVGALLMYVHTLPNDPHFIGHQLFAKFLQIHINGRIQVVAGNC